MFDNEQALSYQLDEHVIRWLISCTSLIIDDECEFCAEQPIKKILLPSGYYEIRIRRHPQEKYVFLYTFVSNKWSNLSFERILWTNWERRKFFQSGKRERKLSKVFSSKYIDQGCKHNIG